MVVDLNDQPPWPLHRENNGSLDVHSMFETIQGEGPFAGHPAVFLRLAGCNLRCPWCDTIYTGACVQRYSVPEIISQFHGHEYHELIVITGGEPFRQNITPLVRKMLHLGHNVQIETNGILFPDADFPWHHERLTVVCSPKTSKIHPKGALLFSAYKYVLSHSQVSTDGLPGTALGHPLARDSRVARPPLNWVGPIYLQPMDAKDKHENELNVQAVVDSVMKHKCYIMGVQMHKIVDLP